MIMDKEVMTPGAGVRVTFQSSALTPCASRSHFLSRQCQRRSTSVPIPKLLALKTPNGPSWCTYSQVLGAGKSHQTQEAPLIAVFMNAEQKKDSSNDIGSGWQRFFRGLHVLGGYEAWAWWVSK